MYKNMRMCKIFNYIIRSDSFITDYVIYLLFYLKSSSESVSMRETSSSLLAPSFLLVVDAVSEDLGAGGDGFCFTSSF